MIATETNQSVMNEIVKAKRNHVNFSKVTVEVEGKRYRFSLTRNGLVVRRWHSQKTKLLTFTQLMDMSIDQRPLL